MNETAAVRADDEPVLVRPSRESDIEAMLAIYRHHVRNGVPRDVEGTGAPEPDDLRDRRKNLKQTRLPHLVATSRGEVVGYAYAVLFRKRPAYRYTAKHSIYVHHEHLGRGVGRLLLQELIDACAAAGFCQMIGYISRQCALAGAARKVRFRARRPALRGRLSPRPLVRHRHGAALARRRRNRAAAGPLDSLYDGKSAGLTWMRSACRDQ